MKKCLIGILYCTLCLVSSTLFAAPTLSGGHVAGVCKKDDTFTRYDIYDETVNENAPSFTISYSSCRGTQSQCPLDGSGDNYPNPRMLPHYSATSINEACDYIKETLCSGGHMTESGTCS